MSVLFRYYLTFTHIIFLIGASHLVVLGMGIYYSIMDLIDEQEPVDDSEILLMSCLVLFQLLIIVLLIYGTKQKKPLFLLPWLVCVFAILVPISCLTLWYASQEKLFVLIFNIFLTAIHWTIWYVVYIFYKTLTNNRLKFEEPSYRIQLKN